MMKARDLPVDARLAYTRTAPQDRIEPSCYSLVEQCTSHRIVLL